MIAIQIARDIGIWLLIVIVLLGALPAFCGAVQFALCAGHRWRRHGVPDEVVLPRVTVLVPAWNEAPVLTYSIDRLLAMDYPADRLRVVVVDDASTDATPALLAEKTRRYPGRVLGLRRENGGQGKAHTLNHGLAVVLDDGWTEAVLITDADVVFEDDAVARMVAHFADPSVGAVSAFIREASTPANWLTRYIGYEYAVAQLAGRRAQNVVGAQACLAGGAQLHTRANLIELGGRIDTTTLAEDTVTTLRTQLAGRRVVFEPAARALAEEPGDIGGLWRQRLRWARGNVQVSRMFRGVFLRPWRRDDGHRLGGLWFGLMWYSTLYLPALMIVACLALVILWSIGGAGAEVAFHLLWVSVALAFVFTTVFALGLDRGVTPASWRQAILFPGLVNLLFVAWVLVPRPMQALLRDVLGGHRYAEATGSHSLVTLFVYLWIAGCMPAAWLIYRLEKWGRAKALVAPLVCVVGYGSLLCAITFAAYVAQARGAAATWQKTEKRGTVRNAGQPAPSPAGAR